MEGKTINGRKRHLAVDTLGQLLTVLVTPADVPDVDGAYETLPAATAVAPTLQQVFVDGADARAWAAWAAEEHHVTVAVVRRPPGTRGFAVQPRRWVVDRTGAALGRNRRRSREVEVAERTTATLISLASCHRLLNRLYPVTSYPNRR